MWCVPSASAAASSAIGGVGSPPQHLGLADDVLGRVHHPVEPAGELEDVLGLERRRERLRERQSQLALAVVGEVLALPDAGRGLLVAGGPFGERVEPVDGRVGLCPKRAEHVGSPRQEPPPRAHARPVQTRPMTAPSTADAGSVASHPNPMVRTTAQRTWRQRLRPTPTPTTDEATTCVVDTGAPTIRRGEDHDRRGGLAREPVDRVQVEDAPADRADDRPPAHRGAERERRPRGDLDPERHRERVEPASRDEERGRHPHRLLSVVGAVAERERGRHHPLPGAHRPGQAARRPADGAANEAGDGRPEHEADDGRDGEGDQDAEDADGMPAVEAAPVDAARGPWSPPRRRPALRRGRARSSRAARGATSRCSTGSPRGRPRR